ncbi:MAG: hypothetical protein ACTTH7_07465 [Treponema sp.]
MQLSRQLCLTLTLEAKPQMQVKRMLYGRCASVQRAAELRLLYGAQRRPTRELS